ncbi:hypothetical protein [Candidatus Parabeggiatoa sp. HSG14]|uniref:hypothetical protein n=1 Tax=Candidatus Parabeggiatoa sp. HSG14 TaxID=3055593 RepID=UPI0025A8C2B2|nr:hypothetical protein [Thiotrichales bacterium HSG14]
MISDTFQLVFNKDERQMKALTGFSSDSFSKLSESFEEILAQSQESKKTKQKRASLAKRRGICTKTSLYQMLSNEYRWITSFLKNNSVYLPKVYTVLGKNQDKISLF